MPISPTRSAPADTDRAWRVWTLWGIPAGLTASALTVTAEFARMDGLHATGALLDTAKIMLCAAWLAAAWRRAPSVERWLWRILIRAAVALGVVLVAITT